MTILLTSLLTACNGAGPPCETGGLNVDTIGAPFWRMTDPVLFSAPYDGGDAVIATLTELLPPPEWGLEEGFGPVAGARFAGALDTYLAERVAALGWPTGTEFEEGHFRGGDAIYVAFLLLPSDAAEGGTSSDHPAGDERAIPHRVYPLTFAGDVFRDCDVFDPNLDYAFEEPPESAERYEGQSRVFVFVPIAYELRSPESSGQASGRYVHDQTIRDAQGSGYHYTVELTVR